MEDTQHKEENIGEKEKEKAAMAKTIDKKDNVANNKDQINIHPLDSRIHLSVHQKLLPPGKIIHIVRHYQKNLRRNRRG